MENYNTKKESYTFDDLKDIIAKLRAKDGCPWDIEQTHGSLKQCMIEEAYEVIDAIDTYKTTGEDENLSEELGDVLLQVMMHAQIASEENRFDVNTVIQGICEKMIRRHPHVFGNVKASNSDEVLENWDEIKKKEKEGKGIALSEIESIPKAFPALIRTQKVLKKAKKLYGQNFEFDDTIDHIISMVTGMDEQEEGKVSELFIGELLLTVVKLANVLDVNSEEALTNALNQFIKEIK